MAAIGLSSSPIFSSGLESLSHGLAGEVASWAGVGTLAAFNASASAMSGADGVEVVNRSPQSSAVWLRVTINPVAGVTLNGTKVIYVAPEQTRNVLFDDDSAVSGGSVIASVDILPVRKTDVPALAGGISTFAAIVSTANTPKIEAQYTFFEA